MASSLFSSQPLKGAYFAFYFCWLPFRLISLAILYYLMKSLRPVPQWGVSQCLGRAYLKSWFDILSVTRHQGGKQLVEPSNTRSKLINLEPPSKDYFSHLLRPHNIEPAIVPALWFEAPTRQSHGTSSEEQKVVLNFPGGAFVLPLATNQVGESIAALIAEHLGANTLFVQYRISQSSDTRFPAALQDSVTAYHHLIASGVDPSRIIISGDSAGGNLALALLRYLEGQDRLPLPSGVMVFSPPVYVTPHAAQDYEGYRNGLTDILTPSLIQWAVDAFLPKQGDAYQDAARPFYSPLHHAFKTRVPVFIHAGNKEAFYDTISDFALEMVQIDGNQVRFHETELAPHDIFLTHKLLVFTAQIGEALKDAAQFLAAHV
ncbi:Alpha/Beta hydrolase protein [Xylaria arbuscula]|nr:Alpha/Beta hydrolase protein [Xylaria arbuscula]